MKFLQMTDGFFLAAKWHERAVGQIQLEGRAWPRSQPRKRSFP